MPQASCSSFATKQSHSSLFLPPHINHVRLGIRKRLLAGYSEETTGMDMPAIKRLLRWMIALNIVISVITVSSLAFSAHAWWRASQVDGIRLLNAAQVDLRLALVHHCLYVRGNSARVLSAGERAKVLAEVTHLTQVAEDLAHLALDRRTVLERWFSLGEVNQHASSLTARAEAIRALYENGYDDSGQLSSELKAACGWSRDEWKLETPPDQRDIPRPSAVPVQLRQPK